MQSAEATENAQFEQQDASLATAVVAQSHTTSVLSPTAPVKPAPNELANVDFYHKAQKYWSEVPATVNGMLGGLGFINALDVQGSVGFLRDLKSLGNRCALDCGAGIGRVSRNLLMPRFATVDLVEQDATFAEKAKVYCTAENCATPSFPKRLGTVYNVGLQEFQPSVGRYDLIWSQWVLGHLTDADLKTFFRHIRGGLTRGGYFVIKENVTSSTQVEKDDTDSSVTRPLRSYEDALHQSGFRIVRTLRQKSFPKELYPVYMIACRSAVEAEA